MNEGLLIPSNVTGEALFIVGLLISVQITLLINSWTKIDTVYSCSKCAAHQKPVGKVGIAGGGG